MRVTDLIWKLARVSRFSLFAASPDEQAEAHAAVLPLIASGQIEPAHDQSFPLEQAPEALPPSASPPRGGATGLAWPG
jgi:NADPH:quinone reductase-like Zn-dependent oxidoreductase